MTEIEACNIFTLETLYRLCRHLETPHLSSIKTTHAKSTLKVNPIGRKLRNQSDIRKSDFFLPSYGRRRRTEFYLFECSALADQ